MKKKTKTQKPVNCSVLSVVPYQLCPKCSGDGKVLIKNWYGSLTSISSEPEVCNLCHGAMIIPMHTVLTEYNIQNEKEQT